MYKLTVVAGPNRGSSYALQEGETSIGRQAGNVVMLPSAKVSKKHCTLVVSNGEIVMHDAGSSNGTFVNGVLSKEKKLRVGDKVSVGDYVFQVSLPAAVMPPPSPAGLPSNVLQFPMANVPGARPAPFQGVPSLSSGASGVPAQDGPPKALKDRVIWFFERKIMPYFYGLNTKHEWRFLLIGAFAAFGVGNLLISVEPLIESGSDAVVREASRRADFMAREIAERNTPMLAQHAETRTEIGLAEQSTGVRMAALIDLDNRIIAPAAKMNQYLTTGDEAVFAIKARDLYRAGREEGIEKVFSADDTVVALEPVKVLNPARGKNEVVALALVSIDTSLSTPSLSDMAVVYSKTLILTGILGALILLVLYRVTLKPLRTLGDDMDKGLKGELGQVTHAFKLEELNPLWDLVNSALQRLPKGGAGLGLGGGDTGPRIDDSLTVFEMLGRVGAGGGKLGIVICDSDRKVVHLSPVFEEISGIRGDGAVGQDLPSLARDQAFGALATELLERAAGGGEASDEFEFSGVPHRLHAAALRNGAESWGYVIVAEKKQEA